MSNRWPFVYRRLKDNVTMASQGLVQAYYKKRMSIPDIVNIAERALFFAKTESAPRVVGVLQPLIIRILPTEFPSYYKRFYGIDVPVTIPEDSGYEDWLRAIFVAKVTNDVSFISNKLPEVLGQAFIYLSYFEEDEELLNDGEAIGKALDLLWVLKKTNNIPNDIYNKYVNMFLRSPGIIDIDKFRITKDVSDIGNDYSKLANPRAWWLM